MFCRHCGVSISDSSKFCPKCGTAVIRDNEKNEITKTNNDVEANTETGFENNNINTNSSINVEVGKTELSIKKHKAAVNIGRYFTKQNIILSCVTAIVGVMGLWIVPQYINSMIFDGIAQNSSGSQAAVMAQLASNPDSEKVQKKKIILANNYSKAEEYGAAIAILEKLEFNKVDSAGDEIDTLLEENCKALLADSQITYAFFQSLIISDDDRFHKCQNDVNLNAAQLAYNNHDLNKFKEYIDEINTDYSYDDQLYTDLIYKCAVEEFNAANYVGAIDIFTKIESYGDVSEYIQKCSYKQGEKLQKYERYIDAISYYQKSGDYSDSKDKIIECNYLQATTLYSKKEYEDALEYYNKANGYKNSAERIKYCKYYLGVDCYNKGDYAAAKKWFEQTKGLESTDTYLKNIDKFLNYDGWYIDAYTCDDYYFKKTRFSRYDNFVIYINLFNSYGSDKKVKIRTVLTDSEGTSSTNYATAENRDSFWVSFNYNDPYWVDADSATFRVYLDETDELLGTYSITLY